jgi:hypothetical protein
MVQKFFPWESMSWNQCEIIKLQMRAEGKLKKQKQQQHKEVKHSMKFDYNLI